MARSLNMNKQKNMICYLLQRFYLLIKYFQHVSICSCPSDFLKYWFITSHFLFSSGPRIKIIYIWVAHVILDWTSILDVFFLIQLPAYLMYFVCWTSALDLNSLNHVSLMYLSIGPAPLMYLSIGPAPLMYLSIWTFILDVFIHWKNVLEYVFIYLTCIIDLFICWTFILDVFIHWTCIFDVFIH